MTLSMDVLRWLTVRALRGQTLVGNAVHDSPSEPADIRIEAEREPYIGVYTDDADMTLAVGTDESFENSPILGQLSVKLIVEIAVPEEIEFVPEEPETGPDGPTGPSVQTVVTGTDQGLELSIGLACRQVFDALNADTVWAKLWRKLAVIRKGIVIRRGGVGQSDRIPTTRLASRIIVFEIVTLREPVRGEGIEGFPFWQEFLTAIAADPEFGRLDELIIGIFRSDEPARPLWKSLQKHLMISAEALRAIGDGPIEMLEDDPEQEATPLPTQVTLVDEETGSEPIVIDEAEEEEP